MSAQCIKCEVPLEPAESETVRGTVYVSLRCPKCGRVGAVRAAEKRSIWQRIGVP